VNAAIFGFDKALCEFNQTRGTSFYTYFVRKAYNEMNKERFGSLLVKRSEAKLKKQRDEELETVSCVSIDKPDQDGHSLVESLIDNTDESTDWLAQFNDLTTLTDEFMKELPPVEKRIVAEIYINNPEGSTLNEVGTELGMCRERVRQLKNRALERMRKSQLFEDIADKAEVA
jgi:RNA polymerase sigma factor (sigma-70 family)